MREKVQPENRSSAIHAMKIRRAFFNLHDPIARKVTKMQRDFPLEMSSRDCEKALHDEFGHPPPGGWESSFEVFAEVTAFAVTDSDNKPADIIPAVKHYGTDLLLPPAVYADSQTHKPKKSGEGKIL